MIIKISEIQQNIALVEEYNGLYRYLWMDTFLTNILNKYISLLKESEYYDRDEIFEPYYIENILEQNKSKEEAIAILMTKTPIEYVKEAIKKVEAVIPIYENLKAIGLTPKKIKENEYYVHYFIK